jgi:hypothetical protein
MSASVGSFRQAGGLWPAEGEPKRRPGLRAANFVFRGSGLAGARRDAEAPPARVFRGDIRMAREILEFCGKARSSDVGKPERHPLAFQWRSAEHLSASPPPMVGFSTLEIGMPMSCASSTPRPARRGVGDDPAVARMKQAFRAAASTFLESDRMVANRTAQLAEMLAKDGKPEAAADLVEGLSSAVSAERGRYDELCQFYFTLRHNGAEREAARAELRARYGSPAKSDRNAQ